MKIAVWHNLPSGGGKRALYEHVKGLVARGHTVESWCPPTADQTYLPLSELIREHIVPLDSAGLATRAASSLRHPIGRALAPYLMVRHAIAALDAHCRECASEIQEGGFDLLFANSCQKMAVSAIGRLATGLPRVLYLQEPYRDFYEARPNFAWIDPTCASGDPTELLRPLRSFMRLRGMRLQAGEEICNAQAYDSIFVNSLFSRESILRAYGIDSRVCYLGVDTDKFHDQHKEREDFVVGIGSFHEWKNIPFVIDAMALLNAPKRLVWIGNSNSGDYLESLNRYACRRQIKFEPKLRATDNEIVDILNRARTMAYAPRLEPFGYAPLEANACGLPVVGVAEGGLRETIVDGVNGLLVAPSAKAMAEAIDSVMADHARADRLGRAGRELTADRWSLPAAIDRLEQGFMQLLDQKSAN